jgi:ABC-type bacteriocin/lantibiotic exporter with double-glycine peptidase domain
MIMRYYGIDGVEADKDYIYKYISPNKLTSGFEIEDYARRHGFKVQVLRDRKYDRIKWLLSQNYPLFVFGETPRGGGHYVVLSGYNEKSFYINDPYPGL